MPTWGMVIDLDTCTACQACTVACRAENNVPFSSPRESELGRALFWNELITTTIGEFPNVRTTYIPRPCMQCERPPCTKVCPVNATYISTDGIVAQIPSRCIGCRMCMCTCPYTARSFNWYKPKWPEPLKLQHNPDVAVRSKGVVEKCIFCIQRLRKAKLEAKKEGKKLRDEDVIRLPACCQTCPGEARTFGDFSDPDSTVSKLARSPRAFRLLEELGTHPKVIYLKEGYDRE